MTCMGRHLSPFWGKVPRMERKGRQGRKAFLVFVFASFAVFAFHVRAQTPAPVEWRLVRR